MEKQYYIISLKEAGFDFNQLPVDLKESVNMILQGPAGYNAKYEILDEITYRSIVAYLPTNELVLSVENINPVTPPNSNEGFNSVGDPNDVLPANKEPYNPFKISKECLHELQDRNLYLNANGLYLKTSYHKFGDPFSALTPIIIVSYNTEPTDYNKSIEVLQAIFKEKLHLAQPITGSVILATRFLNDAIKWSNSIKECTDTSVLLIHEKEVVCFYDHTKK